MKFKNNTYVFWNSKDILSDLYVSDFKYRGLTFSSVKQAYLWKIARLVNKKYCSEILKSSDIKDLLNIKKELFSKLKKSVILEHQNKYYAEILKAKFDSNIEFKDFLIGTGSSNLVYASKFDFDLGSGLDYTLPQNYYINEIRGSNYLGKMLMQIRNAHLGGLKQQ